MVPSAGTLRSQHSGHRSHNLNIARRTPGTPRDIFWSQGDSEADVSDSLLQTNMKNGLKNRPLSKRVVEPVTRQRRAVCSLQSSVPAPGELRVS